MENNQFESRPKNMRMHERMGFMLDEGAKAPERAHPTDAGFDLFAREDGIVPARGSKVFDTGVHVVLPQDTAGLLVSKSGLNVNHDICSTGLIDEGYTGSIRVKLYNHGKEDYHVKAGDKISQLVVMSLRHVRKVEIVHSMPTTERGEGGFGSSGR